MIKIDKIKKSIYFLNINYMLHYNNNTHQIINAIIMMSRTQYNYIDELNGFINDALDYEDEEDTDNIGPIDNRIFISSYILNEITTN